MKKLKCPGCNKTYTVNVFPLRHCGYTVYEDGRIEHNPQKRPSGCFYKGPLLGKKRCSTCRGDVKIKIYECNLFQRCTLTKKFLETPSCDTCAKFRCMRCKFHHGKCVKCGFELENKDIPDENVTRDCHKETFENVLYNQHGNNVSLKGLFSKPNGSSVFFIGGGPSLLSQDLSFLQKRQIVSFAVNNVAAKTVKPNIWCGADEPKSFHDVIWTDPTILKFIPLDKGHKHTLTAQKDNSNCTARSMPNTYQFRMTEEYWDHETFLTNPNEISWGCHATKQCSLGINGGRSVMLPSFYLMAYLGFTKIYLLGCDFEMLFDGSGSGKGLTYAFEQWKHEGGCDSNNECYKKLNKRLAALKPSLKRLGIEVFNCSPNSKLTAFPEMRLAEAIKEAEYSSLVNTAKMYGGSN